MLKPLQRYGISRRHSVVALLQQCESASEHWIAICLPKQSICHLQTGGLLIAEGGAGEGAEVKKEAGSAGTAEEARAVSQQVAAASPTAALDSSEKDTSSAVAAPSDSETPAKEQVNMQCLCLGLHV